MKAIGQIAAVVALAAPLRAWGAAPVPGPSTEAVPLMAYRTVRYVTPSGSDRAGDGSKTKPWATIGHALAQVGSASEASRAAVLVAAGKYRESIELKPYVDLFGGYEAGAWNRDVARFPSVLDGEGKRRIAVGADHARIDGFTLTHGKVRGKGGAILCDHTSPSISNNTFLENTTMGPEDWRPAEMHETANDGGAVAALNGAAPAIEHNLFARNRTENGRGGAIACDHEASPRIVGNVIVQNISGLNDPMRSSDGGGISIYDHSDPLVRENVIAANRTLNSNDAGGIFIALWSSPRIESNWIVGNFSSDDAGGLFIGGQKHHYSTPLDPVPPASSFVVRLVGNTIMGNENPSHNSGASRITMQARAELRDNLIARNEGGLYLQSSATDARNNTLADDLQVLNDSKASRELPGPTVLAGNILWGRAAEVKMDVEFTRNDFRGHATGTNIDRDPMFLDDGWIGSAMALHRDTAAAETSLRLQGYKGSESLVGRVIRFGNFWTVVRSAGADAVRVWGAVPDELGDGPVRIEILPTYRLRPGSPCIGTGENGGNLGVQR